jgi:hypothetical protein
MPRSLDRSAVIAGGGQAARLVATGMQETSAGAEFFLASIGQEAGTTSACPLAAVVEACRYPVEDGPTGVAELPRSQSRHIVE